MKIVILLLLIASITISSLISGLLGDSKTLLLADSAHRRQFKSNPYENILEELNGAHLRFAASHVSLYTKKTPRYYNTYEQKIGLITVPQSNDNRTEPC